MIFTQSDKPGYIHGDDQVMTKPLDLDTLDALIAKTSPGPWLLDERNTPATNFHWGIMVRPLSDEEWASNRKRWADYESKASMVRRPKHGVDDYVSQATDPKDDERPLACMVIDDCATEDDLRFMAEARQAVPALVAEVRRLRALL